MQQLGVPTRVFEQAPRAAELMSALKDRIFKIWCAFLQTISKVDSRDSSADDDHVIVVLALKWLPSHGCRLAGQGSA